MRNTHRGGGGGRGLAARAWARASLNKELDKSSSSDDDDKDNTSKDDDGGDDNDGSIATKTKGGGVDEVFSCNNQPWTDAFMEEGGG